MFWKRSKIKILSKSISSRCGTSKFKKYFIKNLISARKISKYIQSQKMTSKVPYNIHEQSEVVLQNVT